MQHNWFKTIFKPKYYWFGVVSLLIVSMLLFEQCDPATDGDSVAMSQSAGSAHTDSLVVEQLIQRSNAFLDETGTKADALDHFLAEALDIAVRRNLVAQEAFIYNLVGKRLRNRSLYGEALRYHNRSLGLAQAIENKSLLADIYNQIGVVYRRTDDNALALDMHFKALRISEEIRDTFNISVAINSIGNVNFNLGRYHSAIEYFRKSLEFSASTGNTLGLAINNHNIGECYLKLHEPELALQFYFKSLEYNTQVGSRPGQAICFNSIGTAHIAMQDYATALDFLERALQINQRLGDLMQTSISLAKVGEVYLLMKDYKTAGNYIQQSFEIAQRIGSRFQAEESARLLSLLNEQQHNYSQALSYFKMASAYKDSILNEKNMYHLTTMEAIMDVEAQQEQISQLSKQSLRQQSVLGRQRLFLTIFVTLVVVMVLVVVLLVYQYRLRSKYNNLKNQHKLLRSQMNPHFIFNALSAIQVYVLEHDVEKSTRFLTDFAKLMRMVLKISHYDYISLKEETEILKYYLELQKLRFYTPFDYHIHVDEVMAPDMVVVPPMITQPFVENAVEHGIKAIDGSGRLDIRFKRVDSQMIVEVEDNGVGINSSMQQKSDKARTHESMALKITKERLDVIRNDSGGKVGLEIIDKRSINPFDRGTLVRIILPIVAVNTSKPAANG
ncbi:tetratricopeptide repeat-containing sensor histidine kinase [Alkaliflexus imshenetskii]|uniref:tetratricopeptide repeat-containing sensor histidine kinase n=1 Tax=Alkaliflexus imshenetskii TaxID=286730 RepID=UPI0004B339E0|nr:tetratricopeptide repeat protein [Alkaliflexus imshenetskii]